MDERLPFRPVIGSNAKILNSHPTAGYVWFATDTKKIYYSDGDAFLSMGGNTGIYYGQLDTSEAEEGQEEFEFLLEHIEGNENVQDGNYKRPNIDDLILNLTDKCFYRVINVLDNNSKFICEKITLSGGGGGGSLPGGNLKLRFSDPDNKSFNRTFAQNAPVAKLKFIINPPIGQTLENNQIESMTYEISGVTTVIQDDVKEFGLQEFDLTPYLPKMNTSQTVNVKIRAYDAYGNRGDCTFYVNVINIALASDINKTILLTSDANREISYRCTPIGGGQLNNRYVSIYFYDEFNNKVENFTIKEPASVNQEMPIMVKVPTIGTYTMEVIYSGNPSDGGDTISSNSLIYKAVAYNEQPQLVVGVPPKKVEQYSTIKIEYLIAMVTDSIEDITVTLVKNGVSTLTKVKYNALNEWSIYFDTIGLYDLSIRASGRTKVLPTIEVTKYSGTLPSIYNNGLTLNFTAINRSNDEIEKDSWVSTGTNKTVGFEFSNFAWGDINGWTKDASGIDVLHLSSGAKLELKNYSPFAQNSMINGQTIELDFMVSGVTDFSKPLIHCLSYDHEDKIQVGFNITGQESTLNTRLIKATGGSIIEGDSAENQVYNTQIQGLTAKFIENRRIRLTWVIENKDKLIAGNTKSYPMIKTYLNGILSGITQYIATGTSADDSMSENVSKPARLIFDSTYGNIDIYNIRIYEKSALNSNTVVSNYIATYGTTEDKTIKYEENKNVLDNENNISVSTIETAHDNYGYKLSMPYIKISGGSELIKNDDGNYYLNTSTTTQRLPVGKKDYRTVDEMVFIDHNEKRPNFSQKSAFKEDGSFNGIVMYGQGTSSMEYPVKNLRFKSKLIVNDKKFLFTINDNEVDLVCLKVDYMESSGSHNTGTGNLIQMLLDGIPRMKTPGQVKWTNNNQKVLTAIQGFPVAVFYKNSNDPNAVYEFVGKGNFNLDKATHEPFGFIPDPKTAPENISSTTFGWDENNENNLILGATAILDKPGYNEPKYISIDEQPIINSIHCYEFLNNASNLANFRKEENETFKETFFKTVESDGKKVPNWFTSYESRYPEGDAKDGSDINIAPFYRLCSWLNSTSQAEATNTSLDNSYIGLDGVIYTLDTAQYRLAKFKKEFNQYLNLDFTIFYYVLTHILLMIDSRAKNMMIATWDNNIWYPIFYDMDTMLGLNNYGYNKFNYDVEDTHDNIYNGQNSVLWNNVRDAFPDEIRNMYQEMQTAGLTYTKLLENYNKNQADAPNENIYNEDSRYKYIRPFSESYIGADGELVNPGTKDFLYASQGSRSMHREWWLQNRLNYFNGKYLSSEYKNDKYEMRLYTPSVTDEFYYASTETPLKDEFDQGLYYINIYENDNTKDPVYQLATIWDNSGVIIYYKKIEISSQLKESLKAVPPNNDYILTPLYNQYLSIAYGGTNGQTTEPIYVPANVPQKIAAPSGANYNDTETYVYGGSMIKDLGDLSTQYLGAFRFPDKVTKLESLTLGNKNNKYYNPNFSSLSIGDQAPYLSHLNIMNCIGLKGRALSLDGCQNLKQLLATGTDLTSVTLPEYGVLNELRLPATITTLAINNQVNLNNFTIGNYDSSSSQYNYTGGRNISVLDIQNTPIDTYRIVKDCENALQRVRITDFNWVIGQAQSADIDTNNNSIKVLDILNKDNVYAIENDDGLNKRQTIFGTITIKSKELNINIDQAMALYNKYINDFPNINFIFEGLNIYDVSILDGNGNIYWTKKIKEQNNITKEFLSSGPKGEFNTPKMQPTIQYTYTFNNKWHILNENGVELKEIDGSVDEDTNGWPISTYAVGSNIYLKPDFTAELQEYTIKITNAFDKEFNFEGTYVYGTKMKDVIEELENGQVPYQSDSALKLEQTYRFLGYNTDPEATTALTFGDEYIVSGSNIYYAIFKPISVYDNAYPDYYNYELGGYAADPDISFHVDEGVYLTSLKKNVKGKVTIPAYITLSNKKYPVLGFKIPASRRGIFQGNKEITHIFFEKDNLIRDFGDLTFASASKLSYVEFPENLRIIGDRAFTFVPLRPDPKIEKASFRLNHNLRTIKASAFNQCFAGYRGMLEFFIPSSVERMDTLAVSNMDIKDSKIIIGDPSNYSKLNFTNSLASSSYKIISQGTGDVSQIDFYSLNYDANQEVMVGTYGLVKVENVIGENVDIVNVY